jgi:hypothetical protein
MKPIETGRRHRLEIELRECVRRMVDPNTGDWITGGQSIVGAKVEVSDSHYRGRDDEASCRSCVAWSRARKQSVMQQHDEDNERNRDTEQPEQNGHESLLVLAVSA